ncbi:MAG: phosphodiesterase [Treponemataceae bacterium]|nr:phosphodiesterase [Treponemataceae bacterium]
MKYLICSDIHGSEAAAAAVLRQFSNLHCDRLILLGDILYHGPRNPLPEGHCPAGAAERLNAAADVILACRGNCDAEVDQMVLHFPIMADYVQVVDDGAALFCTHGHVYAPLRADGSVAVPGSAVPDVPAANSVVFYGHTHIGVLECNSAGILVCNPGSPSLPKGGSAAGFAVYERRTVSLFDLDGNLLRTERLPPQA